MKKLIIINTIIILGIAAFIFGFQPENLGGNASFDNVFSGGVSNTSSTLTTTSKEIVARNTGRQYCLITNDGSNVVYLALAADTEASSTVNQGIRLASGNSFEIDNTNLYVGAIQALAGTGTSTVSIACKP